MSNNWGLLFHISLAVYATVALSNNFRIAAYWYITVAAALRIETSSFPPSFMLPLLLSPYVYFQFSLKVAPSSLLFSQL
jgi:hypothetical protein